MSVNPYLKETPEFPATATDDDRCSACAFCCTYIAVPIDEPTCRETISNIIWYLYHANLRVYEDEEGDWFLQVWTACEALRPDGLCGVYEARPDICEDFTADDCEVTTEDVGEEVGFDTAHEFLKWLKRTHPRYYKWARGVKDRRDLTRAPKRQRATKNESLITEGGPGRRKARGARARARRNGAPSGSFTA